ncbi:FERM domain-containing protein 7 [Callorhinchus milii]|uniref:FERM domain-containing protein 7 n=1 Tax=Callorhinchus milii TaxID=7868 RepID=UPI001C3F96A2|nr:FERM domain-containing protein 7 [Callorhinchus milii]
MMHLKVHLLDDTCEIFEVEQKAFGKMIFDSVCHHLRLVEEDYFGLEFEDHEGNIVWLDHLKPILKQIRGDKTVMFKFVVKFFPRDPGQLLDELTRYLFAQQIKQDLVTGRLPCSDNSAALLLSHIVQSEVGDFAEELDRMHLQSNKYIPNQDVLNHKIMNFHQKHAGQTPAESDIRLLDTARKLEMYGIRLHPASDGEGTHINLAVLHMGILVFQGNTKINTFNWGKIRKLSFKKKHFLIKLHANVFTAPCKDSLEFVMASRNACKAFWKTCVAYHAFFRLSEEPKSKPRPILCSKGSCFRYSGRTQKQLVEHMSKGEFKRVPFERKHRKAQSGTSTSVSASDLPMRKQVKELTRRFASSEWSEDASSKSRQRRERRVSAVDIVFTTELERSKPEAELTSQALTRSPSPSHFTSFSDSEADKSRIQARKNRQHLQTSAGDLENVSGTMLLKPEYSPTFTADAKYVGDDIAKLAFYSDDFLPGSRQLSLNEERLRPSRTDGASVSPPPQNLLANQELYQGVATRNSCGSGLNIVKEEDDQDDNQRCPQFPKRSRSQSDMKTLRLIQGSDFRPLGYYVPLTRRQNLNKLRPVHPLHVALKHKGPLQVTERYVSSGTESSDSDSEIITPYFHPRLFGKALKSSPLTAGMFSADTLQLSEEDKNRSFNLNYDDDTSHLTIYTGFI